MASPTTHFALTIRYKGSDIPIDSPANDPTAEQVASAISSATNTDPETIKLLLPGRKGHMLRLAATPALTAKQLGKSPSLTALDSCTQVAYKACLHSQLSYQCVCMQAYSLAPRQPCMPAPKRMSAKFATARICLVLPALSRSSGRQCAGSVAAGMAP